MGVMGILVPRALRVEKRRRLMSSRVAAGILSLLAEMNWMRTSSRERAASPSLVMMTRTGMRAVLDVGEAEEVAVFGLGAGVGGDGDVIVGVGVEGGDIRRRDAREGLSFCRRRARGWRRGGRGGNQKRENRRQGAERGTSWPS